MTQREPALTPSLSCHARITYLRDVRQLRDLCRGLQADDYRILVGKCMACARRHELTLADVNETAKGYTFTCPNMGLPVRLLMSDTCRRSIKKYRARQVGMDKSSPSQHRQRTKL